MRFAEIIPGLVEGRKYRRPDPDYVPGDAHYCMTGGPDGYIVIWTRGSDIYHEDGFSHNQDWHEQYLMHTDDLLAEDWEECP